MTVRWVFPGRKSTKLSRGWRCIFACISVECWMFDKAIQIEFGCNFVKAWFVMYFSFHKGVV